MLLSEWRQKRNLRNQIDRIEREYLAQFDTNNEDERFLFFQAVDESTWDLKRKLSWFEEKPIRRTAQRLALDIQKEWLGTDEEENRLSATGRVKLRLVIRQKRRENIEWWVKLFTPLIAVLTGLLAALVALLAFLGHSTK